MVKVGAEEIGGIRHSCQNMNCVVHSYLGRPCCVCRELLQMCHVGVVADEAEWVQTGNSWY